MAQSRPHVKDDLLSLSDELSAPIVLDSPAWYAWLERHSGFAFADSSGVITVRKERGGYWKAYRRTADLAGARLRAATQSLAGAAPPAPAQSPQHATAAASVPAGQTRVDALLHTKSFIPPPRPQRVIRTHLLARLRVEQVPPQLRLVISSRAEPVVHLGRRAALLRAVTLGEPERHVRSIIDASLASASLLRALGIIR